MKNIDKIKAMPSRELAEYIESVFLAGRYYELHQEDPEVRDLVNYEEWLNAEAKD